VIGGAADASGASVGWAMTVPEPHSPSVVDPGGEEPARTGLGGLVSRLWSPPYRRALAWAVPLLLLAYGFAMTNFTLAGDDWFALYPQSTLDTQYGLVAGRWMMPVTWWVMGNGSFVPYFTFAVALLLLTLAGVIACAAWGFKRPGAVLAVVALFVVNPLFTDTLSFKQHHLSYPIGMVCAAAAGWVLLRWRAGRAGRVSAAGGLLVVSLACYQTTALTFAALLLGGEVVRVCSQGRELRREVGWRWLETLAAVAAGIAVYLLSVRVAWWATGADPLSVPASYRLNGGYPSTPAEMAAALRLGLRMVGRFWFGSTTLYPIALKAMDVGLVVAGLAGAMGMAAGRRGGSRRGFLGARAWLLLLGLGSLVLPFAVLFLREDPPMRGNVFTSVGLVVGFWAGLLLERGWAAGTARRRRLAEGLAVALALVTVLGCAYEVNKGYFGLHLSNQRDLANANRMLSVMEQMPQFGRGGRIEVAMAGLAEFPVPGEPFSNVGSGPGHSIVNCSGLSCQNRLVNMLNLIGGGDRQFVARRPSDDPEVAAVIAAMPPWPEPGSIRFLDGVFVVKGR